MNNINSKEKTAETITTYLTDFLSTMLTKDFYDDNGKMEDSTIKLAIMSKATAYDPEVLATIIDDGTINAIAKECLDIIDRTLKGAAITVKAKKEKATENKIEEDWRKRYDAAMAEITKLQEEKRARNAAYKSMTAIKKDNDDIFDSILHLLKQ